MDTNKTGDINQHPDLKPNEITNVDHLNPEDAKQEIDNPEVEVPDFDSDGAITKSDLEVADDSDDVSNDEEKPSMADKIKDALQEWSNDDKNDEDFDNTQV